MPAFRLVGPGRLSGCVRDDESRQAPAPRNARTRGLGPALAATLVVSGCASLGDQGRGEADSDADDADEPIALTDGLAPDVSPPQPVDRELTQPLPPPEPIDELLADMAEPAEDPGDENIWARLREGFDFPDADHPAIERELSRFNARQKYFNMIAGRGEPYLHYLLEEIEKRDLPTELALVAMVESAFEPYAYSNGRASGLWQFLPATAKRFDLERDWWYDGRRDVIASTDAALRYFEYLHKFFEGDWLLSIAAYNAGEGRVRRAVQANEESGEPADFWHLHMPAETRNYVPRILALREVFKNPDEYGITLPDVADEPKVEKVELDGQIDLTKAAEMADVSVDTMYDLNPGFNRWATHPDGPHRLLVPADEAEAFEAELAEMPSSEMVEWRRHEIASGESLGVIADQYGISVKMLRDINELQTSTIRAGDSLLVPQNGGSESGYARAAESRQQATQQATQQRDQPGRERQTYSVSAGDTLWGIASAFDVGVDELASWNEMAPGDALTPGQELVVWVSEGEGSGEGNRQTVDYEVQQGDSLYTIAREFSVSVDDIRRWNGITAGTHLQPGQQLTLRVDNR